MNLLHKIISLSNGESDRPQPGSVPEDKRSRSSLLRSLILTTGFLLVTTWDPTKPLWPVLETVDRQTDRWTGKTERMQTIRTKKRDTWEQRKTKCEKAWEMSKLLAFWVWSLPSQKNKISERQSLIKTRQRIFLLAEHSVASGANKSLRCTNSAILAVTDQSSNYQHTRQDNTGLSVLELGWWLSRKLVNIFRVSYIADIVNSINENLRHFHNVMIFLATMVDLLFQDALQIETK